MNNMEKVNELHQRLQQQYKEEIANFKNSADKALQRVNEYTKKKAEYEEKKRELEPLAGISWLDRMDYHYNHLVEAMKKKSKEEEYNEFAKQFRLLEGYKDSAELADKCDMLKVKSRYEGLIQEKNKATTEEKYRELSKQFSRMDNYENSVQLAEECDKLADECVKQKEREKKARYDALVQEKNNASSEEKYKQLAQKFFDMGNYENAAKLSDECTKQMNIFKQQREERERQEQARIAAKEEEEQAERERQRRHEEEQKRQKQRTKNIRGLMLTFAPFIFGLVLYYTADTRMGVLISAIIFLGVPLVLIHFRYDWGFLPIASVVVFWIAILPITFGFGYWRGSLAMVVAFIMALAYPKDKYWD